jgi:RNA-directed DNA polymerase
MKILENCFEKICSPENIWLAWTKYRKGKSECRAAREFEYHLEENLLNLIDELKSGSYCHGGYFKFMVYDPKQRTISAPTVKDHVAHQAIYNVLYPFYDQMFSPFSYSCRKKMGTHRAVVQIAKYARQTSRNYHEDCWILHGDVRKCFDSINHGVLLSLLGKRICCDKTMALLKKVIGSYSVWSGPNKNESERRGIPLGNLTSQLFINVYLHELDFFVKEKLFVKKYVRYADDFMLVFPNRKECEVYADLIKKFLNKDLKLDFPATHKKIAKLSRGVETLGARFLPFYRKLRTKTYRRSEHLFKQRCREYAGGMIDADALNASWQSLMGMLRYGHNIKLAARLINIANVYA